MQGIGSRSLGNVRKYYPNVTSVVDAKSGVSIGVTRKDCTKATKKDPSHCALAKACGRDYDGAVISMRVAYLVSGNKAVRYTVPPAISREIVSFDRHQDFAPGEYTLNPPNKGDRMGPRKYRLDPDRQMGNLNRRKAHKTAGIRTI